MLCISVAIFLISFCTSLILTPLVGRLATRYDLVDKPGGRKIHDEPTPMGGGIAIFAAIAMTVVGGVVTATLGPELHSHWPFSSLYQVDSHLLLTARTRINKALAILLGGAIIMTLGLVDDKKKLSAAPKLIVQACVAIMLVIADIKITIFIDNQLICGLITILWVMMITNAFNFLDNMDGLSAGIACIVSVIFLIVAIQTRQILIAAFLLTLLGSVGGFLIFNFPPARIFMGDSGALTVGYMLSVLTIEFTYGDESNPLYPIVVPLLILAVPLFDTATVVWIRLRGGRSPFQAFTVGDTNHFSHRLVALGMSGREAVLTIYLVTFGIGIAATILYKAPVGVSIISLIQAFVLLLVILLLEHAGRRRK